MFTTPYTRSTFWSIFLGVLLLIAGFIAIALPPIAGIAASVFFRLAALDCGYRSYWFMHGRSAEPGP